MVRLTISVCAIALLFSCEGDLNFDDDSDLQISGVGAFSGTTPDGKDPVENPDERDPFNNVMNDPTVEPFLEYASLGSRCINGSVQNYLVLSDAPATCETHAAAIDATPDTEIPNVVVLNADSPSGVRQYCSEGECRDIDFTVVFGNGTSGSWAGEDVIQTFDATECDYDTALPPAILENPVKGISVTEVSIYQGVKVPIVQGQTMVGDRNAPVVAGRPGVVRVFIEPQPDWEEREIVAVLTLGELEKEVRFTPTVVSSETAGASTINFDLAQGELPANATFSIKLLEAEQCSAHPGEVADWAFPADGNATDLGVEGLNKAMEIVLAPIRYNADGSGRVPALDAAVVQRYRDIAFLYFPVAEVNVTVADVIEYNGGLQPNGAGFGDTLNFCINQRNQANVAADVYFYCIIQPTQSVQAFCGGGCVAGIAPVPMANDVGNRAGIGIAFDGRGEDTFVHEIGHALGRPHSPCGGAAGADPGYPYNQGVIGTWGYSVLSGDLVDPGAADFMGYCQPSWVSDYTYGRIFNRLTTVLGAQQFQMSTPETRWRTAIKDIDGSLKWSKEERVLTHLPGGFNVQANLFDITQQPMSLKPQVYAVPIADIDATLFVIEDTGFSGGELEIPGVGTLPL